MLYIGTFVRYLLSFAFEMTTQKGFNVNTNYLLLLFIVHTTVTHIYIHFFKFIMYDANYYMIVTVEIVDKI
jgi:hypothetical protein